MSWKVLCDNFIGMSLTQNSRHVSLTHIIYCLNDKSLQGRTIHMSVDSTAQNASATSCDMISGRQFLLWASAESSMQ